VAGLILLIRADLASWADTPPRGPLDSVEAVGF